MSTKASLESQEFVEPQFVNGRYKNPWDMPHFPGFDELEFGGLHQYVPYSDEELTWLQPILEPIYEDDDDASGVLRATWLGHSMVWVNMEGLSLLFDPVLADQVTLPWDQNLKLRRLRDRAPCLVEQFPKIDAVFISNSLPLHFDLDACTQIHETFGDGVAFFVPKGMARYLANEANIENITELSWWEQCPVRDGHNAKVCCLPAQHWSMRSKQDINQSLWASWAVLGDTYRVIHIGDTGYNDTVFKTIGKYHGPFDLGLIPIGGYTPRAHLKQWHIDPQEAVYVHQDLRCKQTICTNYGTWFYGLGKSEHYNEPQNTVREIADRVQDENGKYYMTDENRRVMDMITCWQGQTWTSNNHGIDGLLMSAPTDDNEDIELHARKMKI